jgi:hypothetical protein
LEPAQTKTLNRWIGIAACIVAVVGVAAIWAGVTLATRDHCGWMIVLAALDAALLLRLAGWPAGRGRAALATAVTLLTGIAANFLIAASQIGFSMGMRPVEAVPRMSLDLALLYAQSNNTGFDLFWWGLALFLAWRLSR